MASLIEEYLDSFWSPHFWLLPGFSWSDFDENGTFPRSITHIFKWYWITLTGSFLFFSSVARVEFFPYLGTRLGVIAPSKMPARNDYLELCHLANKGRPPIKPTHLQTLAEGSGLNEAEVKGWFQMRAEVDRPSDLLRFSYCGWRCVCSMVSFSLGMVVLWGTPWFNDVDQCLIDYPFQDSDIDVEAYYAAALSIYSAHLINSCLLGHQFELCVVLSQAIIVVLLVVSWIANFTRIGSLVLIVQDCSDVLLELSRFLRFVGKIRLSGFLRAIFSFTWISTRLMFIPFGLTKTLISNAGKDLRKLPAFLTVTSLLDVLFCLNCLRTLVYLNTCILKRFWRYWSSKADVTTTKNTNQYQAVAEQNQAEGSSSVESTSSESTLKEEQEKDEDSGSVTETDDKQSSFVSCEDGLEAQEGEAIKRRVEEGARSENRKQGDCVSGSSQASVKCRSKPPDELAKRKSIAEMSPMKKSHQVTTRSKSTEQLAPKKLDQAASTKKSVQPRKRK